MARFIFFVLVSSALGCGSEEASVYNGALGAAGAGNTDVVEVSEGDFNEGPPPTAADAGALPESAPRIVTVTGPPAVTNGGSVILNVQVAPPVASPRFVVGLVGATGYHTVTGVDPEGDGTYEIRVQVAPEASQTSLSLDVALLDADGNPGPYHRVEIEVIHSGTGDVKVTLSFDRVHDLDLHVIEPSGFEIYYQHPVSGSGGQLDLDSGSHCMPSAANAENIFWPSGGAPAGEYKVLVQNYEQCTPGPIAYRVRIVRDGVVDVHEGTFDDGTAGETPTAANMREIVTFTRGQ